MIGSLLGGRRTVEAHCTLDIEKTADSFHVYAVPEGVDIEPGDSVLIHGAPAQIAFGDRYLLDCRATVMRAGPLARLWTRIAGFLELTELYEVGFQPKETP